MRRAFRILPIYAIITAVFLIFKSWGEPPSSSIPWFAYVTLTQNFWMAHQFSFGAMSLAVTWSLAIEEQFYLTIPLLIRKLRLKYLAVALTVIVVAALLLRLVLHFWVVNGGFASYVLMPSRADSLCLGVLSAIAVRNKKARDILRAHRLVLNSATLILFLGLVYMTYKAWPTYEHPMSTFGYSWLALFYTCVLLGAVTQSSTVVHRGLCNSVLMRLGTIAYCTYLIHRPLIWAGRHFLFLRYPHSPNVAMILGGIIGLTATLILAALSWKYFEKPLLQRGHKYQYE
jgi:peptidoglycan/LPS O-acetylase OafA/YrhL